MSKRNIYKVYFVLQLITTAVAARARPALTSHIIVSGPSPYAVEAAQRVYKSGGNVVDATVAAALALSVVTPHLAALGGGGFAVVHMKPATENGKGTTEALDFREVAPATMTVASFSDKPAEASITGGLAVGVPGIPAGLFELHKKYGKKRWRELFVEALAASEKGFAVGGEWAQVTAQESARFSPMGRAAFLKNKQLLNPGERLKQAKLHAALILLRDHGVEEFYRGLIAKDIIDSLKPLGSPMVLRDLEQYRPQWRTIMSTDFRGHQVHMMPLPSSAGIVLATAFKLLELPQALKLPFLGVTEFHMIAESLKLAFRGRMLLADPGFTEVPVTRLLSTDYFNELKASFSQTSVAKLEPLPDLPLKTNKESNETTHLSVLDREGNAVAMTLTMNGNYGSGVVTNKFGILLNNQIDDFTTNLKNKNMFGLAQSTANQVEPGKRPLSSMAPTIVTKEGKVVMVLGGAGGPRIISAVLQVLYRVLNSDMNLDLAVQSPRVHHQFIKDVLFVEPYRFAPETLAGLKAKGHSLEELSIGRVYAVRKARDGTLEGAFDARGDGATGGY